MTEPQTQTSAAPALYRAFWRWHFYAGLIVLPMLMLMALTGGLYLFKAEIEATINRPLMTVAPSAAPTYPDVWATAVRNAVPGKVVQAALPESPTQAVQFIVEDKGARRTVFVDPADGTIKGAILTDGFMQTIKRLHSLDIAGPIANLLVEVVAGWAIVMVFTGVVLWWPRGQRGGVVSVRGSPKQRLFWRDLHAVAGIFGGVIIVFLAATGMPWSAVWGKEVRALTTQAGWGRPAAPASASVEHHHEPAAPEPTLPWSQQETDIHAGHAMGAPLTFGQAVANIDAAGLPRPYVVNIPADPAAAWSAAYMPDKVEQTRTLYLAGVGGQVIGDIGYGQYGPAAKTIEWGIAVHQGNQFGLINKLVMLAGCIAVWLLGISALVMWWKRRPKGKLGAPPPPQDKRGYAALALVVAPLAILYPLVGASIVIVLALDWLARLTVAALPTKV